MILFCALQLRALCAARSSTIPFLRRISGLGIFSAFMVFHHVPIPRKGSSINKNVSLRLFLSFLNSSFFVVFYELGTFSM